jgi:hypothetical protein
LTFLLFKTQEFLPQEISQVLMKNIGEIHRDA